MSRLVAFVAGLTLASAAPSVANRVEVMCQPVLKEARDCTLGGYFNRKGRVPLECEEA